MSTALQRLIMRPSSLAFLKYLLRASISDHGLLGANRVSYVCHHHLQYRLHTVEAVGAADVAISSWAVDNGVNDKPDTLQLTEWHPESKRTLELTVDDTHIRHSSLEADGTSKPWGSYLRTFEDVEFQSDLDSKSDSSRKLVDDPRYANDFELWAYLLEYRKNQYGDAGVALFWDAVRERNLQLPTQRSIAEKFWPIFLQTGFSQSLMLRDICRYADELYDTAGRHWSKLYVYIMQHIILEKKHDSVIQWHERLIERYPPSPNAFSRLVGKVVVMGGDLEALMSLYKTTFYTNNKTRTYGRMISVLLQRRDFHTAMQWHFFLVRRGDRPLNRKVVAPLIRHFEAVDPAKALELKKSLGAERKNLIDGVPEVREGKEKISRELINIVHGKAFGIEPKKYSDRLGARWFATNWISLDLAINTIHALGVEAIGPLSLQAIALREANALDVVHRIDQLKHLGISTGKSVYSKAVEIFARNGEIEYLEGLIRSDQHPDSYEDIHLQDKLLAAYGRAEDWARYRLTAAVRAIESYNPRACRYNIMQRANISRGDRVTFFQMLEEMRVQRIPCSKETVLDIIAHFLPPREKGHIPDQKPESLEDLQTVISVLSSIMKFGSYVPSNTWAEIIRRLGMLGRLDDLEKLCVQLTAFYKPTRTLRQQSMNALPITMTVNNLRFSSHLLPTSHELHPLRVLFSNSMQRALVEWAFKPKPLRRFALSTINLQDPATLEKFVERSAYQYTRGVKLLRWLQDEGVHIEVAQIRLALQNRFAILFKPGRSRTVRNNLLKQQNVVLQEDMVAQLNKAWGTDIWSD